MSDIPTFVPAKWRRGLVSLVNRNGVFREDPREAVIYVGGEVEAEEDDETVIRIQGVHAHLIADLIGAALAKARGETP